MQNNITEKKGKDYLLTLKNRERLALDGILEVLNFDESMVLLQSELGELLIEGEKLHIVKYFAESGELIVEGKIDGIFYPVQKEKKKMPWQKAK